MSTEALPVERTADSIKQSLTRWAILISAGVFSTSFPQAAILRVPFQNLLKAHLNVSRTQMAMFFSIVGFFWYIKPFVGIIIDNVPLLGTRRRYYLLFGSLIAGISWMFIPLFTNSYWGITLVTTFMETMLILGSTVVGGLMVEGGRVFGASGRLSSVRNFIEQGCFLIAGPLGGWLATRSFGLTAGIGTFSALLVVPVAYSMLREPRVRHTNKEALEGAVKQLGSLFRNKTLWTAAGMLFLVYFVPGFVTPIYYYQTDVLKFSQPFIGTLTSITGGMGMLGAVFYGAFCRRVPLRKLIYIAIILNATLTLTYLFYTSATRAIFIDGQNGFVYTLAELAMMDLATRATPKGSEAMGFALMMSVRNIALFVISDPLASWLADRWHFTFHNLVWLNAGATALAIFAVPFLPGLLVDRPDHTPGEPPAPSPALSPAATS